MDYKKGDIVYYSFKHHHVISVAKATFIEYQGNKANVKFTHVSCLTYVSEIFRTPIEAFEYGLKKYADVW